MHRTFATISDKPYLPKLLIMHESLLRHSTEPFTLNVLALDMEAMFLLDDMHLENVTVIPLSGFEYALNLSKIKATRTWKEFAWGCASSLLEYLLPWTDADGLTYLDADLFFLGDPAVMFQEIGERSIAIIPHRFIPSKQYLVRNGTFNVGWLTIRNTETGRRCITRWSKQVRNWCFDRVEGENACGDQKFLDEWPTLYGDECCIIQNIGANLAPWNLANWKLTERSGEVYADDTKAVFFHAHEFQDAAHLTNYELRHEDRQRIYQPYVAAWTAANERIAEAERKAAEQRQLIEMEAQRA